MTLLVGECADDSDPASAGTTATDTVSGDTDTTVHDDATETDPPETLIPEPRPPIFLGDWVACDLSPGTGDGQAECATAAAPQDYAQPDGPRVDLFLKRYGGDPTVGPQVWLMHGGPSASAVDGLNALSKALYQERPDLTFYAVDHRGIGGSGKLECPAQQAPNSDAGTTISDDEAEACGIWLTRNRPDLAFITTSNAARDLGYLIEELRPAADTEVFVYGGSYGRYLAQRYMQIFPDQPTGVILEGISAPGVGFGVYSREMNTIGEALFELCAEDPTCLMRLGPDPWASVDRIISSFDDGHCEGLQADASIMRALFAVGLFFNGLRDLVPAIVYRAERCA